MMPRSVSRPDLASRYSSTPMSATALRVFHLEVAPHQAHGVGPQGGLVGRVQADGGQLVLVLGGGPGQGRQAGVEACAAAGRWSTKSSSRARWTSEPLVVWGRGRLGQLLDAGEPERQRARGERLDPGGRQVDRHRECHGHDRTQGVPQSWCMKGAATDQGTDDQGEIDGDEGARPVREADRSGGVRGVLPLHPRADRREAARPAVVRVRQGACRTPTAASAAYFWLATLSFADAAALGAGHDRPRGQAAADDVPKFATGGVTIVVSEF